MISFKGRIGRKSFLIQSLIIGVVQGINLFGISSMQKMLFLPSDSVMVFLLSLISMSISVGVLIFSISIYIRRWHDLGKSGWWTIISFVPPVNIFVWFYLVFKPGDKSPNQYGPPQGGNQQPSQQKMISSLLA